MPLPRIWIKSEAVNDTSTDRLRLRLLEQRPIPPALRDWDFHSIVWETRENDQWREQVQIAKRDIQRNFEGEAWITTIHSFNPHQGRAVLMIAHEGVMNQDGQMNVEFTWREWDLNDNKEIQTIAKCEVGSDSHNGKVNSGTSVYRPEDELCGNCGYDFQGDGFICPQCGAHILLGPKDRSS